MRHIKLIWGLCEQYDFLHAKIAVLIAQPCSDPAVGSLPWDYSTYWPLLLIGRWISHINSSVSVTYWLSLRIYSIVIQIVFPFWFYTSHISCWNRKAMALYFLKKSIQNWLKATQFSVSKKSKRNMLLFIVNTLINTLKGGCCLETGYLGYSFIPSFIHSKLFTECLTFTTTQFLQ